MANLFERHYISYKSNKFNISNIYLIEDFLEIQEIIHLYEIILIKYKYKFSVMLTIICKYLIKIKYLDNITKYNYFVNHVYKYIFSTMNLTNININSNLSGYTTHYYNIDNIKQFFILHSLLKLKREDIIQSFIIFWSDCKDIKLYNKFKNEIYELYYMEYHWRNFNIQIYPNECHVLTYNDEFYYEDEIYFNIRDNIRYPLEILYDIIVNYTTLYINYVLNLIESRLLKYNDLSIDDKKYELYYIDNELYILPLFQNYNNYLLRIQNNVYSCCFIGLTELLLYIYVDKDVSINDNTHVAYKLNNLQLRIDKLHNEWN
jgi:hypothetical protein